MMRTTLFLVRQQPGYQWRLCRNSGDGTDTKDFIKALNDASYGGYSDWRLPTIKELTYIVNYSITYPGATIDTGFFPNTQPSWYWSSTTDALVTNSAWSVYFYDGRGNFAYKYLVSYVRAVRQTVVPDIKANGIGGEITVTSDTPVSIVISLISGNKNGKSADWWFAINSPWGWYYLTTSGLTQIPIPLYQSTPLYDFSDQKMIDGQLPVGEYEFFFGVYITPNDSTDSPLYLDSAKVHVN